MTEDPRIEAAAHVLRKYFPTAGDGLALHIAEEQLAAADRAAWIRLEPGTVVPKGQKLVTNNPGARTAYGDMSHLWNGLPIWSDQHGEWVTFDEADRKIRGLTHYQPLPAPPTEADHG